MSQKSQQLFSKDSKTFSHVNYTEPTHSFHHYTKFSDTEIFFFCDSQLKAHRHFCPPVIINGVFGSVAVAAFFLLPWAGPKAFLARTSTVKSPVIKQLQGPLWGDLAPHGRCQSACNHDLHRPVSRWPSAILPWADAQEPFSHLIIWYKRLLYFY